MGAVVDDSHRGTQVVGRHKLIDDAKIGVCQVDHRIIGYRHGHPVALHLVGIVEQHERVVANAHIGLNGAVERQRAFGTQVHQHGIALIGHVAVAIEQCQSHVGVVFAVVTA